MPNPAHRPEISTHPRSIGGLPPFQLILDATIFRTPCMYHMASRPSAKFVPHRPVHLRHSWDGRRPLAQGTVLTARVPHRVSSQKHKHNACTSAGMHKDVERLHGSPDTRFYTFGHYDPGRGKLLVLYCLRHFDRSCTRYRLPVSTSYL